jgi:hypothetical protein
MTYPDSGSPADPRDELDAIRHRLAELTPGGPRGTSNGLLVAGGLALAGALVALLVAIAVASTLDGGGQAAVLIVGLCVVAGFAVLGLSVLRRWQIRAGAVRRQRLELLARQDELAAELGSARRPGRPAYRQPAGQNRNDRLRIVVITILAVLVVTAVLATIVVQAT